MNFRSSCLWTLRKIFFHFGYGLKDENEGIKKYCDIFSVAKPAIRGRLKKSVLLCHPLTLRSSKV